MRLDKFLKVSGLIKRRSVAKEACAAGRVSLNGRLAKAATEVHAGDLVEISLARRYLKVEILEIPRGNVPKPKATELYRVLLEQTLPEEW
ncbi:MAG TPA: RNA-binding S4 domain-containing protein [Armatimonadetes bacterium]|nr:RNA-binding S4 domain-containing protein [Armatimonadota bacterium]